MRALSLFPHPDDESFSAGGLLHRLAARGIDVQVVTVTSGEAIAPTDPASASVADLRLRELARASTALGATQARSLNQPDSRPDAWDAAQIRATIEQLDPDVIITFGADGGYGHRDHVALYEIIQRSRWHDRAAYTAFPRRIFHRVHKGLRRYRGGSLLAIRDPAALGCDGGTDVFRFELPAPDREAKLAAVACHRSQLKDADPRSFLHPGFLEPLLKEEWFIPASEAVRRRLELWTGAA